MSQSSEMTKPSRFEALGFANTICGPTYYVAQVSSAAGACIHVHIPLISPDPRRAVLVVSFFPLVTDDDVLTQYISYTMQRATSVQITLPEYLKAGFQVPFDTDLLTLKSLIFAAADKILEHQHAAHSPK